MKRWILLALLLAPLPAAAEDLVADLSAHEVDVTTGFNGSEIIAFGSVKKPADIAIVVEGPKARATVRKKSRIFGIWINTDSYVFDDVPGYYAVATSKPAKDIATPDLIAADGLTLAALHVPVRGEDKDRAEMFRQALMDRRVYRGFYREDPNGVAIQSERLFRATFPLPANVPIGQYVVHVFALRNNKIDSIQTMTLSVDQIGLSAEIVQLAKFHSFLYACLALTMAIAMGGGSAWIFRRG